MNIFTQEEFDQMLSNGESEYNDRNHVPLVEVFITNSACRFLLTEIHPYDYNFAYGLCDFGKGCPEMSYVSIKKLQGPLTYLRLRRLKRNENFVGKYRISAYLTAAKSLGKITTDDEILMRFRYN